MKQETGFKYISSCRLCLANNRRTIDILNTQLQPLYEKLINNKIHNETPMCFLCLRRLQQCHQFVTLIKDTRLLRENYIKNGYMMESKPPKPVVQLTVNNVMNFAIPFESSDNTNSIETIVKLETEVTVKEEPATDEELEENGDDSEERDEDSDEDGGDPLESRVVSSKATKRKQTNPKQTCAKKTKN